MVPVQDKRFIVYKSSAGSGKTFTLVREYLAIVLRNPEDFRKVLAITFTNKAANEMKERVVKNLIILADPGRHEETDTIRYMLPELSASLGYSREQIAERALAVLRLIMHHYAEFAISTIDSFTHRVIRTFAHDLKIPLNFEVELDAGNMLSEAVDMTISRVGSDEALTRAMVGFVEKKAGDELNWNIEKDLNDFGKNLLAESGLEAINEIRRYDLETFMQVRQSLNRWIVNWKRTLSELAGEVYALFEKESLPADAFIQKDRGIYAYIKNLAAGNYEKLIPNSYAEKALQTGEWINQKGSAIQLAAFDRIAAKVLAAGNTIREMLEKELSRYILCGLLLDNLYSMAVLSEIEKALNSLCEEDNKLLISEFNRRISGVVREQPAPFIYERIGERYHHYLIDEFQDTSIMQWHNLLPLIENSLASGGMNLVVGDSKQAIYRWRSGDAEQFEILPKLLRTGPDPLLDMREQALEYNYRYENLAKNHRSGPVIVNFNNRLFASISSHLPEGYGTAFRHAGQETAKADRPGMVTIEKINNGEDGEGSYQDRVYEKILQIINGSCNDGFRLKDLAILCRKNEQASGIASFLISNNIPVISSESLLLTQSEKINFLVAWLSHLVNPSDTIPVAHILHYLLDHGTITGISLDAFFAGHKQNHAEGLATALSGQVPGLRYQQLGQMEIFGLIQYLKHHFNLNVSNDGYLQFFQDAVLDFIKTKKGGLPEFLEWWEEKSEKLSVIVPEGIDAVRIMTIHKAKGLQFPVVIYPFADETLRSTRDTLWVKLDEELARPLTTACLPVNKSLQNTVFSGLYDDEMNRSYLDLANLLYVVMTRPEERLHVILKDLPENTDDPVSVPKMLSRFLKEEGMWESGRETYNFGETWQKERIAEPAGELPAEETPTGRAVLKMLLRRHAPTVWDMESPDRNREWGNLVHLALSEITGEKTLEEVLEEMTESGLLSNDQKDELSGIILSILTHKNLSLFFRKDIQVMNEPEILDTDGKLYRPDRVVLDRGKVSVLEYKTGRHREEHVEQVKNYCRLLAGMDYPVENAFLVYLDHGPEMVRVV